MARPQLENGYTRLANELIEALMRTNLSAYQSRVLWAIWRKTYGFQKKEEWITLDKFIEMTGLKKPHLSRTLSELLARNMITRIGNKTSFNKDYQGWRELPKRVTVTNRGNRVTDSGYRLLPNGVTTYHAKATGKSAYEGLKKGKKGIEKKVLKDYSSDSVEIGLSKYLFSLIYGNFPNTKEPNYQSWAKVIDLMLRIDKRTPEEIRSVITWAQGDSFWSKNILSTEKLRKQYDQLNIKRGGNYGNYGKEGPRSAASNFGDGESYPVDFEATE
jgi:phage replication O-like protein O